MNYGLTEEDIRKINRVFSGYPNLDKVIIYGSRAKGNYKNGSDIDLTLMGDNLSLDTLFKIENDLEELLLPYKMDVSIFDKIENDDLVEHIRRVGKIFYQKH